METTDKYCVIGAGASGLVVAKTLREQAIPVEVLEREDDVGGNWYYGRQCSSVYASTHLISSKRMTEFTDFAMPKEYPPYPSHAQALEYLRSYARHFGLYESIRFQSSVLRVEPATDGDDSAARGSEAAPRWLVTTDDGQTRSYRGLIIASGHHWDPLWPELQGKFNGKILHARDYKTPDILAGKRVLVIGAGNSGCDIAVEAAQHAAAVYHSLRRGYHFLPKFVGGTPIDSGGELLHRWRLPLWARRAIVNFLIRMSHGRPERYGLPAPDHRLLETHPIVNSQLLYFVGHGRIQIRPAVQELLGNSVRFDDGREDEVDLILCATGYRVSFPFLDERLVFDERGMPRLFLNAFHPRYDNFFVAGLIQPNSGLWSLVDWQARLMAAFVRAQENDPAKARWFHKLKASRRDNSSGGIHYIGSERHKLEVEYFAYRERLKKLLSKFGVRLRAQSGASRSGVSYTSHEP
jgi:thioredoxin reductase